MDTDSNAMKTWGGGEEWGERRALIIFSTTKINF